MGSATVAGLLAAHVNGHAALILGTIALPTVPTRQFLMPAINRASDEGQRTGCVQLHGLSVGITLAHIAAAGIVWVLLPN